MIEYYTLGALQRAGYSITAFCTPDHLCRCWHSGELDLGYLVTRFGPEFDLVQNRPWFTGLLRCTACGRKQATIRLGTNWKGLRE